MNCNPKSTGLNNLGPEIVIPCGFQTGNILVETKP
jgi:hypothetical protein